jgi:hypothetical protein
VLGVILVMGKFASPVQAGFGFAIEVDAVEITETVTNAVKIAIFILLILVVDALTNPGLSP